MDVSPSGSGTIEVNQTAQTSYPADLTFANGESVSLKAVPNPNYEFASWEGSLSGTDNPITVIIDCDKNIAATFSQGNHVLTIDVNGSGSTNPTSGSYSYPKGTEVTITASPDSGWHFDSWTGDVAEPESNTTVLTMDSSKTVTANFSQVKIKWWLITIAIAGVIIIGVAVWSAVKSRTA